MTIEIERLEQSCVYRAVGDEPTKRYSGFVGFRPYDPGDVENGPRIEYGKIEEIDVDASSYARAREIIRAVLEADYEEGGQILEVRERFGLYF